MPEVKVNGVKLHYESTGSGIPLICIHPPLLTGEIFNYQQKWLSDVGQIITFDIRGHGQSKHSSQKLTYTLVAQDILGLMDRLGIPQAYLCGYSTGGAIALEVSLLAPDRVLGSILISAMSEVSDMYNKGRIWAACAISKLRCTKLLSAAITWGNADKLSTFGKLFKHAVVGNSSELCQYYEASYLYNCTNRLQEIHSPVLLVYGEKDTSFQRYAELFHQKLANSKLFYIPKAKHQIPTKNPKELHKIIRSWLADKQSLQGIDLQQIPEVSKPAEHPVHPAPLWNDTPEIEHENVNKMLH